METNPNNAALYSAHIVQLWRDTDLSDADAVRFILLMVGFSKDECQRLLGGLGVATGKNHRWTDEEKATLIDMYTSGVAWDAILEEIELPPHVVRGMVGRLRLRRPPKGS